MADNQVFITGAAEGSLASALNGLPPWATESTAVKIQGILQRTLNVQNQNFAKLITAVTSGDGGKGLSPDAVKKLNKEVDDLIKGLTDLNEDNNKRKKNNKEEDDSNKKKLVQGKKFESTQEKMLWISTQLAVGGSAVLKVYDEYIDTAETMWKSGVNLIAGNDETTDSMTSLQNAVRASGLQLATLQKVALEYSQSINTLGFTKFAKAIPAASAEMLKFGIKSEDAAMFMGSYIESQSRYSDIQNMSASQLAANSARYGAQITRLTQLTGVSTDTIKKNIEASSKSAEAFMIQASLGPEARKNMLAFTAGMDDSTRSMMMAMAAAPDPRLTEQYQTLVRAGMGDLAESMAQAAKIGVTSAEAGLKAMHEIAVNETANSQKRAGLSAQAYGGNEAAKAAALLAGAAIDSGIKIRSMTEAEMDASKKSAEAVAGFRTETEKLGATLQAAFAPLTSQIQLLADTMKIFNNTTYAAIGMANQSAMSWLGVGLIATTLIGSILGAIGGIITFTNLFKSASTGLATEVSKAPSVFARIFSFISSAASGLWAALTAPLTLAVGSIVSAIAGAAAAFYVGWKIGTAIYEFISSFEWAIKMFDFIFIGLDKILSFIPGSIGKSADARIAARGKANEALAGVQKPTANKEISVPKNPAPSTVNSPAAVAIPPSPAAAHGEQKQNSATTVASVKEPSKTDINNMMAFQNSLLEQILLSTNRLVSVNNDILKYTRIQS